MAALSKRARKVRKKEEFDLSALLQRLSTRRVSDGVYSWTLAEIQAARDAQMRGDFRQSARLADAFATDSAMFVARRNRLAMQRSIPVRMVPANDTARAVRWCAELDALYGPNGVGVTPEVMVTLNRHLADHGVGFGVNAANVRADGSRIDLEHHVWPISEVRVDPAYRHPIYDDLGRVVGYEAPRSAYLTRVEPDYINEAGLPLERGEGGVWQMPAISKTIAPLMTSGTGEIEIVHGDGRWTIYASEELEPWKSGCVLPGALVWASHAFGFRDMNKTSRAHGNVRVMGMLPEGMAIDSAEGVAYLDAITALVEGSAPAGIQPFGAATTFMSSQSGMWQIFSEIIKLAGSNASQIYNGHDGLLGTNSAGPGVDLETLLKISNGVAEGDLHTIERCFGTGVIEVCTALNIGDSSLSPGRIYQVPDTDQGLKRTAYGECMANFTRDLDALEKRFVIDQAAVAKLAEQYGVDVPILKPVAAPATVAPALPAAPTGPKALPPPAANGAPRLNGAAA